MSQRTPEVMTAEHWHTRMHRTHVRRTTVSGRSNNARHRENKFTQVTFKHEPSPRTDRNRESAVGYQVVRHNPETGVKEYAWFNVFGTSRPNSWQSVPCPIPFGKRAQADAIVASLGHHEHQKRIGRGKYATNRTSYIREADVWVELNNA